MLELGLVVGAAWLAQGLFLWWAYGAPFSFGRDGTPKAFVAGERPQAVRDIARLFHRFSQGASLLVIAGAVLLGRSLLG